MAINGQRVGDAVLTPGWTSYNKRLQYQTYDVTGLLKKGPNAVGVTLGNAGIEATSPGTPSGAGTSMAVTSAAHADRRHIPRRRQETLTSDGAWKSSIGPILMSEIYHGETYDARLEKPGWSSPDSPTARGRA